MEKGKLVVISGPSATGKGTIIKEVLKSLENTEISVSMTTRDMREGESEGEHYYFVSDAQFQQRIQENGFLEYAKVYDNYYGTPKEMVLDRLDQGVNVILEIDVQGAMQIKKNYPKALFIFILPPSLAELRRRIEERGTEETDVIELRLKEAKGEIEAAVKYDHAIINDDLDEAVAEVEHIIKGEEPESEESIESKIKRYEEEIEI